MVCNRCIKVLKEEFTRLNYTIASIELGEVQLKEELNKDDLSKIRQMLTDNGFELIDDRKSQIINRIKTLIIEYIHYDRDKPEHENLSEFLGKELGR